MDSTPWKRTDGSLLVGLASSAAPAVVQTYDGPTAPNSHEGVTCGSPHSVNLSMEAHPRGPQMRM